MARKVSNFVVVSLESLCMEHFENIMLFFRTDNFQILKILYDLLHKETMFFCFEETCISLQSMQDDLIQMV